MRSVGKNNNFKQKNMDNPFAGIYEQIQAITKAHGYDILLAQVKELDEIANRKEQLIKKLVKDLPNNADLGEAIRNTFR